MQAVGRIPGKRRAFGALLALLGAVLVRRAASQPPRQRDAVPAPEPDLDSQALAERLSGAIKIPSVSHEEPLDRNDKPFDHMRTYLEQTYPRLHEVFTRELVSNCTLLYTWPGTEASLDPILLLAHQDVVPVEPGTEDDWEQRPFSGNIVDGHVWGRGALDNKENLIGLLEAADHLVRDGFRPRRTVVFVFGHDEEVGGTEGAAVVARLLAERGARPAFVLDEGGLIVDGMVPGVQPPVAVIGVAEKGYASIELVVEAEGGHSSTPPLRGAIGILAEAVLRLERSHVPPPPESPLRPTLEAVAPEASFVYRLVYSNLWLFQPLMTKLLSRVPGTAEVVPRTTAAPTVFQAGAKDNVVPGHARAVVHYQILPGDTIDGVLDQVRQTVADDRVRVTVLPKQREPTNVAPTDSEHYLLLSRTIRETFPGTVVAPYLEVGGSDSRLFEQLTENVFRFMPFRLSSDDLNGIHGVNERVSVDALAKAVSFYVRLIRNAAG